MASYVDGNDCMSSMDSNKSKNWTFDETYCLLDSLQKRRIVERLDGRKSQNGLLFKAVFQEMRAGGFHDRNPQQIRARWKALRNLYAKAQKNKSGSGPSTFQYWAKMEEIMEGCPLANVESVGVDCGVSTPDGDLSTAEEEMDSGGMTPDSNSATKNTSIREACLSVRTKSNIMSEIKQFTLPMLDLESFLSAKVKLRQEGLLDSHLKSNLEHVARVLDAMPAVKRRDVSLLVEGERQLVKFVSGTPGLHYTVRQGTTGPELLQRVQVGPRLTRASIAKTHFAGHYCRDDFESCMERAHQVVGTSEGGLTNVELKIACGELRLTYTTPQPQATIEIRPQHRVNLGQALTLEKILEVKNSMEQTGAMSRGLQACFQHLLANHSQYQGENSRIVLQSDGEMVELISGRHNYHSAQHFIFTDSDNQVQSHKVQDIDLWDDS